MNKTENNNKVDFSNIRDMQNLMKNKSITNFAENVKSFNQRVKSLTPKIDELKKANEALVASKVAAESKKVEEVKTPVVDNAQVSVKTETEKKQAQPVEKTVTEKPAQQKQQNAQNSQAQRQQNGNYQKQNFGRQDSQNGRYQNNGNGDRRQGGYNQNQGNKNYQGQRNNGYNNQNGNRQQGGKFTPTGERRFDNNNGYGDRRQGGYNQNGQGNQFNRNGNNQNRNGQGGNNFQRKPFGQNNAGGGFGPRLPKPTETFSASTLASKNNRNAPQKKKSYEKGDEKKSMNKKALLMRGYVDENGIDESEQKEQVTIKKHNKKSKEAQVKVVQKIEHAVITTENLTVKILAEAIGKTAVEIVGKFLQLGRALTINSNIAFDEAELIAEEFGVTLEKKVEKTSEEKLKDLYMNIVDPEGSLEKRPPVVTVMGHVDHGKTSLLDRIRKTNVVSGEAGGITQSIGAYTISINGETITFIDTPGHEAFSAMRARGAKLTDIAILVVAADDGVMPQTVESIKQIKEANVPMIVAINKIDRPGANIDNVKTQLANYDVLPEEWGGDAIMVPISAKQGINIDKLLEMVLFLAEFQNLQANPNRKAQGTIIEAQTDKGVGAVATVLVQNGTLKVGDSVIVGTCSGKIRAMTNDKRERIKSAGPSIPVQIMGLSGVPNAGSELYVLEDEKLLKEILAERIDKAKRDMIQSADTSIENLINKIEDSKFKDYNVIIKADVQGSVEALKASLLEIQNEEVKVRVVYGGVGAINENDISTADASNALIVAFNTKPDFKAKVLCEKYKVEIKSSKIIYEVIDYIKEKIDKMVTPKYKEVVTGHAEIRATFKASKVGLIAGTYVLDGKISRDDKVRVYRKGELLFEGEIGTIQREKNEAKAVDAGFECGVTFEGFTNFTIEDTFETYRLERIN